MIVFLLLALFVIACQASTIARQQRIIREFDTRARGPRVTP